MTKTFTALVCMVIALAVHIFSFAGPLPVPHNEDPCTCGWSISPVFGYLSSGFTPDTPGNDVLVWGVKVSHRNTGTMWVDLEVTKFEGSGDTFLMNARANYPLFSWKQFIPYASTGAGFIATGSGVKFDFLFGSGFLFEITDRFSVEEAYIIHYSPSQAFTDAEGNPSNSLETSIHFWF